MPPVSDPVLRTIGWIPSHTPDFMQGESRDTGQVIPVRGWNMRSDVGKLRALRDLAQRYGGDPKMRVWVVNNVLRPVGVPQRDYARQAGAMLAWVQRNVYYTNEPDEQVQSPWYTIRVKTGDCDDSALLLATMAQSIRLPWRFALAGTDKRTKKPVRHLEGVGYPGRTHDYAHIYVQLGWPPFKPAHWKSAEPTVRGAPLGYDVVEHGIQRWGETAASGLPELGAWGSPDTMVDPAEAIDGARVYIPGTSVPWSSVVEGVITGVITGVATGLLIDTLNRRRR